MIILVEAEKPFDKIQRLLPNARIQRIRNATELAQPDEGHIQSTANVIFKCERLDVVNNAVKMVYRCLLTTLLFFLVLFAEGKI